MPPDTQSSTGRDHCDRDSDRSSPTSGLVRRC